MTEPRPAVTPHAAAAPAVIEFKNVIKRFGTFAALDGLDLSVPRGEVFGLLGPNGSGKTTAIRILTGLDRATSGSVDVLGKRVPDRTLAQRIGYMPQETALYLDMTVRENLELFADLYDVEPSVRDTRIADLLKLVELSSWSDTVVTKLSGGMRHRTSLVAALLHEPELLVLDEPTVGIDPELRASFWKYFGDLSSRGVTVLITTHYMDEARHCGRIGFLRAGKLIAEGTPEQILAEADASDLEVAFLRLAGRRSGGGTAAVSA